LGLRWLEGEGARPITVLSVFRVPSERAQPKLRSVYCAALPSLGLLAPGHSGPGIWTPNASLYKTSWIPKGTRGFPTERDCKAQGLEGAGAKARSRGQEHERETKRARPRGRDQEAKSLKPRASMSGPPTERGCKAQDLEGARALRPWGSDASKARGHGRSPCYRSSVFRRKGSSPS
jgi:hypothetical protein